MSLFFLQNIERVDIRKRLKYAFLKQFYNVEVRIGSIDIGKHPLKHITPGTVCGKPGPKAANAFPVASFLCKPVLSGRYLTAQELSAIYLEATEIDVFQSSKII